MKYFKFLLILIGTLGWSTLSTCGTPGVGKHSKKIQKEFELSEDGSVYITNKYGNVDIETYSGSAVSFDIDVEVDTRNADRAEELLENINIDFKNSQNKVSAATALNIKKKWGWLKGSNRESYSIHYKVKIPKSARLYLRNKYGNVSSHAINNDVVIEVKHGNCNLGAIRGDVEVILDFGNGSIQGVRGDMDIALKHVGSFNMGSVEGNLDLEAEFSRYDMGSTHTADIDSKYSHIYIEEVNTAEIHSEFDNYKIDQVNKIEIEGKYDSYKIGTCQQIDLDSKFTNLRIESLTYSGDFDTSYGSVNVKRLDTQFKEVYIDSNFTGYDFGLEGGSRLDLETEYTNVKLPDEVQTSFRDKDGSDLTLQGFLHHKDGGLIEADMNYGHLSVKD